MFLNGTTPYTLNSSQKQNFLVQHLRQLMEHHEAHCPAYARVVRDWRQDHRDALTRAEHFPYLPVSVFKEYELRSTAENVLELNSSATTSGTSSRIFSDKLTRKRQSLSANKIWTDFLGNEKRPYLVFDLESTVRGKMSALSARGAAILSLAHMASEIFFVVREEEGRLCLDIEEFNRALRLIGDGPFWAYGFTYIVHQIHEELPAAGVISRPAHPDSAVMHSGGWKRLQGLAVDKPTFNRNVADVWGFSPQRVIDFYGVVEQVGVFYPDCSEGIKHVPYWAEVVIRESDSCEALGIGDTGLIQLINCLPVSAPNHSVMTEDLGELVLEDGCKCGRRGRAFVFKGRAPRSEIRGCSDVGYS